MEGIKVTITNTLPNEFWGWDDLLNGRKLTTITRAEIFELLWEDIQAALEDAKFEFEIIE